MTVCGDGDVADVMRSDEIDVRSRPAERAVDPGLVGLLNHVKYGVVVRARGNVLDDGAAVSPFDCGDCRALWSRGQVNSGGDHRSTLWRQEILEPRLSSLQVRIS
jgi:hypothetical protein